MEDQKYIDQLRDIRTMMDRSSRFVSLSGISGVLAGVYAIAGALASKMIIDHRSSDFVTLESREFLLLIAIAFTVMVLSIVTAVIMAYRKAKKTSDKLWNSAARRLVINFSIPLATGGLFGFSLLYQGHYGIIAPITLIFYGLSLINASKYTLENMRYLGIAFIVLGLINTLYPGYGLQFWTIGFGGFHIVYGLLMYVKFERTKP